MIKDIELRRLKDVKVRGCFTLKTRKWDDIDYVVQFFQMTHQSPDKIKFKELVKLNYVPVMGLLEPDPYPDFDMEWRLYIMYESLHELLKLREVFQIRANKFDMYLIEKRGYNPFDEHFFKKLRDPVIHKVRK